MPLRAVASHAQERYFHNAANGCSNFSCLMAWRLRGMLDEAALERAVTALCARHEALRTTLRYGGSGVEQLIADAVAVAPATTRLDDADSLTAALVALADEPFAIAERPLTRIRLLRAGDEDHTLAIVMHHAVSDGWTCTLLHRELTALYAVEALGLTALAPPPDPPQLRDHARADRAPLAPPVERFWRRRLEAPRRPPTLAAAPWGAGERQLQVDAAAIVDSATMAVLASAARARRTTLMACLLGAAARTFAPHAGGAEVAVAVVHANRMEPQHLRIAGLLAGFLPVHVPVAERDAPAAIVDATTTAWLEALTHTAPLGALWELHDGPAAWPQGALCDLTFNFQPAPRAAADAAGEALRAAGLDVSQPTIAPDARAVGLGNWPTGSFPFELNLLQRADGSVVVRSWRPRGLLDDDRCRQLGRELAMWIEQFAEVLADRLPSAVRGSSAI